MIAEQEISLKSPKEYSFKERELPFNVFNERMYEWMNVVSYEEVNECLARKAS